ncbi:hypothetical protein ACH5RR_005680 [Cinchona calisaya]|uniref:Late embryogenesis abundant protein LEA-2 subgroup domain-containing protein n=1 Tax=Cinchona calisaya TaxID=153742 RepID=A0ABD3AM53_9GENT
MASSSTNTAADGRCQTVHGLPVNTSVVTGYPVGRTPPPPPPPPPMYRCQCFHHHNQDHRMKQLRLDQKLQAMLYRLTFAALCLFFFMVCLIFTLWLFLHPRMPQVHLASVTLSPLSTAATNVLAACNVSLLLTNPNRKLTIFYDNWELFVGYQSQKIPLFKVQVPPFSQPQENGTILQTHMEISNGSVGNDMVKALNGDLVRGSMNFWVKVFALMRLESKEIKTRSFLITVHCDDVIVGFSSINGQGTLLNPYKDCQISL